MKNNIDIKPKNNTYENIREIVLDKKENIKNNLDNNSIKTNVKSLKHKII